MTYLHVQQLALIRDEFDAARAVLAYAQRTWNSIRNEAEVQGIPLSSVENALGNLEITYILRAFVRFEALRREHLKARRLRVPYKTETLIDRVAQKQQHPIPDDIRRAAQNVREHRNSIVHSNPSSAPMLDFREALRSLNYFLACLEDIP